MNPELMDQRARKRRGPARRHPARSLERALRGAISRLSKLEAFARQLRERVDDAHGDPTLRCSLDFVTREIEAGERALEARAITLCGAGSRSPFVPPHCGPKMTAPLPKLVARLAAGVKSCGKRLCALLRAALAIGDRTCAQAACAILRALEKELWLLRPNTGAAPSFVIPRYKFHV